MACNGDTFTFYFLAKIVMGDETWLHHFESETKRTSVKWHYENSPKKKKFKKCVFSKKLWLLHFFDSGFLLVDIMPHRITINSDSYMATLNKNFKLDCVTYDHIGKSKMFFVLA